MASERKLLRFLQRLKGIDTTGQELQGMAKVQYQDSTPRFPEENFPETGAYGLAMYPVGQKTHAKWPAPAQH